MASSASPYSARAMPYASAASALSGERSRARFRSRRPSSMRSHARCSFPDSMSASMAAAADAARGTGGAPLALLVLLLVLLLVASMGRHRGAPRKARARARGGVAAGARRRRRGEINCRASIFANLDVPAVPDCTHDHTLEARAAMTTRPPELSMDAKWEAAIDLTLRRLVYGSRPAVPRPDAVPCVASPPRPRGAVAHASAPPERPTERTTHPPSSSPLRRRGNSLGEPSLRSWRRARLRLHRCALAPHPPRAFPSLPAPRRRSPIRPPLASPQTARASSRVWVCRSFPRKRDAGNAVRRRRACSLHS